MESEILTIQNLIDSGDIDLVQDGNHGGNYPKSTEFVAKGIPLITGACIENGRIDLAKASHLTEERAKRLRVGFAKAGDVILSHKGTMGKTAIVPCLDTPYLILNPQLTFYRINPSGRLRARFLKYFFDSAIFQSHLVNISGTSTINTLSVSQQKKLEIPLPDKDLQDEIVAQVSTLDDKIELNRRVTATLERMAQALFKSWFVDFDSVIDNALAAGKPIPDELTDRAEVRRQALANGTANREAAKHFPDSFDETEELGWIPEGWKVEPLGEHLDVLETGRRPKGGVSKYKSGVPSVGAESIFGIGQFNFGKLKFVPEEFFEKMNSGKVESYDVLLYKDGGKPGEFKPRSGMYGEGFPFESFGINEHVFRMRSSSLGQAFLYYQVSSERVFHHFAVRGGKAAIPGINQKEVNSVDFLIPGEEVRELFNDFSQPIFEKILKAANQSRMLERLRDTLLPQLISGELQIQEAEKVRTP